MIDSPGLWGWGSFLKDKILSSRKCLLQMLFLGPVWARGSELEGLRCFKKTLLLGPPGKPSHWVQRRCVWGCRS